MLADVVERKIACAAAMEDFEKAADAAGLSDEIRQTLRSPENVLYSRIPVAMRDGRTERVNAWCVRHNASLGPAKGGVCCHPALTLDDLKAKAMFMSWRWALLDIPCGGGTAGVAVAWNKLAPEEAERLRRGGLEIVSPPAPGWEGGATAPEDAAARGVFYGVQAACEHRQLALAGARVVVLGFGKTGSGAALLLAQAGAAVIGVSDTRGAIYRASGLDIPELSLHKSRSGSVVGLNGAEPIADHELLSLDCDILVASAVEGVIRNRNAPGIRARMVVEAADCSVTAKADSILDAQGVAVIPDIVANAGRDAAAYYDSIGAPDLYGRLQMDLRRCMDELRAVSLKRKVSLRRAAYIVGVSRVAEATRLRGTGSNAAYQAVAKERM